MQNLRRLFFSKGLSLVGSDGKVEQWFCYTKRWDIVIKRFFGLSVSFIRFYGYDITVFTSKAEADSFVRGKRIEYLTAKKYIKL